MAGGKHRKDLAEEDAVVIPSGVVGRNNVLGQLFWQHIVLVYYPALIMHGTFLDERGFYVPSWQDGESPLPKLVMIPTGNCAAKGNSIGQILRWNVDGEIPTAIDQSIGEAGRTNEDDEYGFAPDDADSSPTDGHDILFSPAVGA